MHNVSDWHERLGGGTQADSIMDRIVHNSYTLPTTDKNLRMIYDSQKAQALIDSFNKIYKFINIKVWQIS